MIATVPESGDATKVEARPVLDEALSKDALRDALLRGLNEDLAAEYGAIIMYTTYAARVSGPFRPQLAPLFLGEIAEEQGHARLLAQRIVALGGEPATWAQPVPPASTAYEMLQQVLRAEERAVRGYTTRVQEAEAIGETALAIQLEELIVDETSHRDEVRRILRGWPMGIS